MERLDVPAQWHADETVDSMRQRVFTVAPDVRRIPAVLWTPAAQAGPFPLVLIGHGGAGHKLDESRLDLARRYTSAGFAAAAIDGPWHGDRASAGRRPYDDALVDSMVEDWRMTLDVLVELPEVDADRVGYGGVSMGTMFGLPFVASEPRVRSAVLGLCGYREADGAPLTIAARLERDAAAVHCPVLFLLQWDDDLFERAGCLELFDALATPEKQLLANTGLHHESPEQARDATTTFLVRQLATAK